MTHRSCSMLGFREDLSIMSKGRMKSNVWMWRSRRHVNVSQAQILPSADEFRREKCSDANPLS